MYIHTSNGIHVSEVIVWKLKLMTIQIIVQDVDVMLVGLV
jgi:hypothetical protein